MPSAPHPEATSDQDRTAGSGQGGDSHGPRRARTLGSSRAYELLLAAVEHHALPRLLAAHAGGSGAGQESEAPLPEARPSIGPADVEALLTCVSTPDFHLAEAALAAVARRGFTRAELLVDLLAPAARHLHDRWREDRETFAAVTLATGRLQRLLRSDAMPASAERPMPPCGKVLVGGRSDHPHPFEAAIVADLFRSAHWDAECVAPRTERDLAERLEAHAFDCLVLVLGADAGPGDHRGLMQRMRRLSANPALLVLVSGPSAGDPNERLAGADALVASAADIVSASRNLLMSRVA